MLEQFPQPIVDIRDTVKFKQKLVTAIDAAKQWGDGKISIHEQGFSFDLDIETSEMSNFISSLAESEQLKARIQSMIDMVVG